MPHISKLKALFTRDAGLAVEQDKFYVVNTTTGEATPWPFPPYALPDAIGAPGQVLAVNAAGTGLEWVDGA